MNRIMIAGTHSGCGKTTVACGILQAFVNRGLRTAAFKCGPDYIDPMFHSEIIGAKAGNLDGFFMDKETLRYLLLKNGGDCDISVIEGVMGYYDGIGMKSQASSCQIAADTQTPAILVVDCRGMSRSIKALINGFLGFEDNSRIKGMIFNRLPRSLYPELSEFCVRSGIRPLGYFPFVEDARIESRHLGLVTAREIADLRKRVQLLAEAAEQFLDLDGILQMAGETGNTDDMRENGKVRQSCIFRGGKEKAGALRIAVARDRAFCFYYKDNLDLLREYGCELVEFSPLKDKRLPADIDGLLLGGGYPELYGEMLSDNKGLLSDIRQRIEAGLPTHAECGGFLYLHREMTTPDGKTCQLVGALDGACRFTARLQHFGYAVMTAWEDNLLCKAGETIPVHEFHRYVSDLPQTAFDTEKNGVHWGSYLVRKNLTAGFPHIHYYANLRVAESFLKHCEVYQGSKELLQKNL